MSKTKIITPIHYDSITVLPAIQRWPEFMQFVQWYATPGQFRELQTQKEFARAVGVHEDTLTDWKRHPSFRPLALKALQGWMQDHVPDVVGGLYNKATSEKTTARDVEMFMRLAGMEVVKRQK